MTRNYQLWEEKQSQAWTGHGKMQEVRPQQTYRELLGFDGCRIFTIRQMNSYFSAGWQWNYFCSQNFPLNTTHSTKLALQLQPARSSVHFSHCAPGLGTPKLSVQYSVTAQLWRSLFFPQSMDCQWWHDTKYHPLGSWFSRSCHSLGIEQWLIDVTMGQEL